MTSMASRANIIAPTVLAAGYRGVAFVKGLIAAGIRPTRICSYPQRDDQSNAFDKLAELSRENAVPFETAHRPEIVNDRLVYLVGWQYLIHGSYSNCIVFHDLILPQYRGFAPTVTALLCGNDVVGVTAFIPNEGVDTGNICGTRTIRVRSDTSLQAIADLQTAAMIDLAIELATQAFKGRIHTQAQDASLANYSLWRDDFDYFIDWRRDANFIVRHIQFVGFPYRGAKALLGDKLLTIRKASFGPDLTFAIRDPGKLWQIDGPKALVVCGEGTVWVDDVREANGQQVCFKQLRSRFLTADTAWIAPIISNNEYLNSSNLGRNNRVSAKKEKKSKN